MNNRDFFMDVHKFIAECGIDRAETILSKVPKKATFVSLTTFEYFYQNENSKLWMQAGFSTVTRDGPVTNLVALSELEQVVKSVKLIKYLGGYERLKSRLKVAKKNKSDNDPDAIEWKKAIAVYELILSFVKEKVINSNGWIKAIDQLPTLDDADDAGLVFQCEETPEGFKYLNNIHIELLKMDSDNNHLSGREYWHPKQKAPSLPIRGSYVEI